MSEGWATSRDAGRGAISGAAGVVPLGLGALLIPIGRVRLIDGRRRVLPAGARAWFSEGKRIYTDFLPADWPFGITVVAKA